LHRCVKFHDTLYAVYGDVAVAEPVDDVEEAGTAGHGETESLTTDDL
jgi:hypothetical protein